MELLLKKVEMEIKYWIYLFKDSKGNTLHVLVENEDEYIYIDGLVDGNGVVIEGEIKANESEDFGEENKVDVKIIEKKYSFQSLWIQ